MEVIALLVEGLLCTVVNMQGNVIGVERDTQNDMTKYSLAASGQPRDPQAPPINPSHVLAFCLFVLVLSLAFVKQADTYSFVGGTVIVPGALLRTLLRDSLLCFFSS